MKTIAKLGLAFCFGGALSYGAIWHHAKLMDASCYDQNGKSHAASTCAPTASTTNFIMESQYGKIYKLDADSNLKVQKAIEDGVVKADHNGDFHARVTGKREAKGVVTIKSIVRGESGEY